MMRVHLVNPSDSSFGIGVITPRWLYVLAAATPSEHGDPLVTDETLEQIQPDRIQPGDIVGIGIHTGNALRGMQIGRIARERGAWVVYGGIHATLYPEEAFELGGAHAVVKGDGDMVWAKVIADLVRGPCVHMKADGFREISSCLRVGTSPHAIVTCGPRYKRCAVARSTVRFVPCGAPTARSRGSARRTS